jgi:hypothetical protein
MSDDRTKADKAWEARQEAARYRDLLEALDTRRKQS